MSTTTEYRVGPHVITTDQLDRIGALILGERTPESEKQLHAIIIECGGGGVTLRPLVEHLRNEWGMTHEPLFLELVAMLRTQPVVSA